MISYLERNKDDMQILLYKLYSDQDILMKSIHAIFLFFKYVILAWFALQNEFNKYLNKIFKCQKI